MWKIIVHQVLDGEETSVNSNLILGKEKNTVIHSIHFCIYFYPPPRFKYAMYLNKIANSSLMVA